MSVPISSFSNTPVSPGGRLAPIGRSSAINSRISGSPRDTETVVHLSEQAQAILAGLVPIDVMGRPQKRPEVTIVPVPGDDAAARDVESDPFFGAPLGQRGGESEVAIGSGAGDLSVTRRPEATKERQAGTGGAAEAEPSGRDARTPAEERAIQQLRARDVEVRAHEAAHAAVAGALGGRPSLEYVVGPDGHRYAVGGEVSIDTSPGRTPEETIAKARTIRAAATAPASPSAQDMAVAAAAARMEAEAQDAIRERHTIERESRTARASGGDEIRRVEWSKVGSVGVRKTSEADKALTVGVEPVTPPPVAVALAAAPPLPDSEMMMLQLVREQRFARGGMGHTHLSTGCGFCRSAAATYASV